MEYVDKKKAVDAVFNGCGACTEEIEDLPTVDIIRCKECAHSYFDEILGEYWCREAKSRKVGGEEFCSRGKER